MRAAGPDAAAGPVAALRILSFAAAFHRRRLAAARVYAYCPPPEPESGTVGRRIQRDAVPPGVGAERAGAVPYEWNATYKDARGNR